MADVNTTFYTKDIITIAALVFGPIIAVAITLISQRMIQKRDAKERLFVTIMGHRKSRPTTYDLAQALNLIDVIYAKHPKVVRLWHELYDILYTKPFDETKRLHKYLELLSEMSRTLGYKSLSQTDMDKFYIPEAHLQSGQLTSELQTEFLRVLKATQSLSAESKQ
jgi:hypothetical protein